ncbi:unnamed protein product, partial [marine sediment metagenome]
WWYYCNLAERKRIVLDEEELRPVWCPLLKENENDLGNPD